MEKTKRTAQIALCLSLVLMLFIFVSMPLMNKYDKTGEGQILW